MNNQLSKTISRLHAGLTAGTLVAGTLAMTATSAEAASNHSAHVRLARAVERTGITVYVNHKICDELNLLGFYTSKHKSIVICQENRPYGVYESIQWTEEDYDTLRHEVHHVVQDCRDGINGELHAVYDKPIDLGVGVMGESGVARVAKAYEQRGTHIQVMEIEAFAVAALNDPDEQVRDINTFCF